MTILIRSNHDIIAHRARSQQDSDWPEEVLRNSFDTIVGTQMVGQFTQVATMLITLLIKVMFSSPRRQGQGRHHGSIQERHSCRV